MATDPRWVNLVEKSIEEILTDHAYCEQKAASSCISLIVTYSQYPDIVSSLTPIVEEEWGHFKMVLEELRIRNLTLGKPRKDEYVNLLQQKIKSIRPQYDKLLTQLLINALIEARSCERFKLLSQYCADLDLRKFYKKLMVSEAGHYTLFLKLAKSYFDPQLVDTVFDKMLELETQILSKIDLRGDRMH
ncbi:MAG: tRNA-(ms[2]io[6]A)-hydroxylase [Chitinophagales bacterium]|nr:tRNA-(ms[2]io[6]A)-hydroxylase [Chitinophagales bacterium]